MVQIKIRYKGDLHCTAQHGPSRSQLTTDAPADNQGKGATLSPTDLVATALGTCMLTTIGIAARRQALELDGLELSIEKIMTKQPPRRIERFHADPCSGKVRRGSTKRPSATSSRSRAGCPVALSLRDSIAVELQFDW